MIKKLKRKFVLINMCLVTAVLLIVFAALFVSTWRSSRSEAVRTLTRVLDERGFENDLRPEIGSAHSERNGFLPVFCVQLNENGDVLTIISSGVNVSDEIIAEAVQTVADSGESSGTIKSLALSYDTRQTELGLKIAFVDITNQQQRIRSFLFSSVLIGALSILAIFLISELLAGLAVKPVERSWQQQQQFVADASHELKTPLTVILANLSILSSHRSKSVASQQKWLDSTHDEAVQMKKLVDDLLYLAKSDAQQSPFVAAEFNCSDALWDALLPFESLAFEKGVTLESDIAPDVYLCGDESQFRQLATILIDNALKYCGEQGRAMVTLQANDGATLKVSNSGATIPAQDIPHLFDRFYRVDSSRSREQGGYGLGLAIAKSIAERHGAHISVSSQSGSTVFCVEF